ncbi:MAG: aminotransferase class V-fold PLP-dependent enzyme, partial [Planctomycetia bacterium]
MAARTSIYLDHAAATPLHPAVAEAIEEARGTAFANPSSQHAAGRAARRVLEDARDRILALLGCRGGVHRDRPSHITAAARVPPIGASRPYSRNQ